MDLSHPVTTMNFTENQQGSAILEKLHIQRKQGQFCDVTFHVKNQDIPAHRNVLAASSPYFDALLKQSSTDQEHLTLDCKDFIIFETLLEYIYTGTIVIDSNVVEELICLSHRFLLPKLKGYCCEYLERNINVTNCFATKAVSQKTGLVSFCKTVDSFIMANIMDVIQQDELLAFSDKNIMDFVSNKTLPVREEIKIHVMNRWVRHSLQDRQYRFHNMLNTIVWSKINIPVVYTLLREDVLYKTSPWCLYTMLKSLEERGFLPEAYQETFEDLRQKYTLENMAEVLQITLNSTVNSMLKSNLEEDKEMTDTETLLREDNTISVKLESSKAEDEKLIDTELEDSGITKNEISSCLGEELYPSLNTVDSAMTPITDEDYHVTLDAVEAMSSPKELDSPLKADVSDLKKPGRHKRKGIPMKINPSPIKVRISKVKLKVEGLKVMKRRGRPPKLAYKKQSKKHTGKQLPDSVSNKADVKPNDGGRLDEVNSEGTGDTDHDKDGDVDEDDDMEFRVIMPKNKVNSHKGKRGRKPKKSSKSTCEHCDFVTTSAEKLEKHREKAHKDTTVYKCSLCNYHSAWNREYYNHMKTHFPGPPFHCDYSCGYVSERIQSLLYHRMSHTDERPYDCTICNMSFRSKNNLAMHARCHTGLKPFQCEVCSRSFATKGTLDQHSVTHSDLRPYLCDLCGFSTKYQSHLIAHKRIHSGDVFRCQYPNCKYSTPKRSQLACHMRTHMSIRSHICSQCGRAFVEKSHLVRHEKIHLDDKPFKCEFCDYGSTRRDKLKDHVAKYHGELSPKTPYKPRKNRRQTFDPNAFPLLNSEHASAEMQSLLQQSVDQREQDRQDILADLGDTNTDLQSHLIIPQPTETLPQPLFTVSSADTVVTDNNVVSNNTHVGQLTTTDNQLTTLHTGTVQSMLPSLLDPRLPIMLSTSQQPIMVVPHSLPDQMPGLYNTGCQQVTTQTLTQMQASQISQEQQSAAQQDFTGLQFMNIFNC